MTTTVSAALAIALCPASLPTASAQSGIEFRDMVGVAQGDPERGDTDNLWDTAIGFNRAQLSWPDAQSGPDASPLSEIQKYGRFARKNQNDRDVGILPVLGYAPSWATDKSDKDFTVDGINYHLRHSDSSHLLLTGYVRQQDGSDGRQIDVHGNNPRPDTIGALPLQQRYISEWTDFVHLTVQQLMRPTYGHEQYYQIWNEAHPRSGFFDGGFDDYFSTIHFPAAQAIHEEGGKVVYGGWPTNTGQINNYIDLLNHYDAWDSIDVLDLHYHDLPDMEALRQAAADRGYDDIGIWQTEVGNTANTGFTANYYPRFAKWAIEHNPDDDPDRYKLFYFAQWDPDSTHGGFQGLFKGPVNNSVLTENGKALRTLGNALSGDDLALYDAVDTDRGLAFDLDAKNKSSIEAFTVDDRIVVAVHLDSSDDGGGPLTVYLSDVDLESVDSAQRIRMDGDVLDLAALENTDGQGIKLVVPTDNLGFGGGSWDSNFPDTFLVRVNLLQPIPEPASAALLGLGIGGVLLRRRGRGCAARRGAVRH